MPHQLLRTQSWSLQGSSRSEQTHLSCSLAAAGQIRTLLPEPVWSSTSRQSPCVTSSQLLPIYRWPFRKPLPEPVQLNSRLASPPCSYSLPPAGYSGNRYLSQWCSATVALVQLLGQCAQQSTCNTSLQLPFCSCSLPPARWLHPVMRVRAEPCPVATAMLHAFSTFLPAFHCPRGLDVPHRMPLQLQAS